MRSQQELENKLREAQKERAALGETATIDGNARLALTQLVFEVQASVLEWVLENPQETEETPA